MICAQLESEFHQLKLQKHAFIIKNLKRIIKKFEEDILNDIENCGKKLRYESEQFLVSV